MKTMNRSKAVAIAIVGVAVWGCGDSGGSGDSSGGATSQPAGTGGAATGGSGGGPAASGGDGAAAPTESGGAATGGQAPDTGGTPATGGATPATGGATLATGGAAPATGGAAPATGGTTPATGGATPATGGTTPATGGAAPATGGATPATGGATPATGGTTPATGGAAPATGGTTPATGGTETGGSSGGDGCIIGGWEPADPSAAGPFATETEEEVGPEAGEAEEDGVVPRFTLFRPADMAESGRCHPVITWGNGTGSTPSMYGALLRHFASHGFVVIGSNSTNVSRGDPKPMVVGVTWVLEQNEDPSSPLYHRLDPAQIGATGHSQGAMATSQASADERIVTSVPIEGAMAQRNLHGPAMFFCGGLDDLVGCDGARGALDAVDTLPAMYANYLSVDHGSWMSWGNTRSEVETAITAWMRVHLMADTALRPWFYGASCELCSNAAWEIDRKNMEE